MQEVTYWEWPLRGTKTCEFVSPGRLDEFTYEKYLTGQQFRDR